VRAVLHFWIELFVLSRLQIKYLLQKGKDRERNRQRKMIRVCTRGETHIENRTEQERREKTLTQQLEPQGRRKKKEKRKKKKEERRKKKEDVLAFGCTCAYLAQ
jgi:phosphorylcholine metabolism protein LicD